MVGVDVKDKKEQDRHKWYANEANKKRPLSEVHQFVEGLRDRKGFGRENLREHERQSECCEDGYAFMSSWRACASSGARL